MPNYRFAVLLAALVGGFGLTGTAAAAQDSGLGYDKLCLVTTAPGGQSLPTVCVYYPLGEVPATAVTPTGAPA